MKHVAIIRKARSKNVTSNVTFLERAFYKLSLTYEAEELSDAARQPVPIYAKVGGDKRARDIVGLCGFLARLMKMF